MSFSGLGLAGGVLQAGSSFLAGQEQRNISESEANRFTQQAHLTKISTKLSERQKRKSIKRLLSTQHAGYVAGGVALTGSPLDVMLESAADAELDIAIDRFNAENEIRAAEMQSGALRKAGRRAETAGKISAASTLLMAGAQYGAKQGLFTKQKFATVGGQQVPVAPKDYYKTRIGQ